MKKLLYTLSAMLVLAACSSTPEPETTTPEPGETTPMVEQETKMTPEEEAEFSEMAAEVDELILSVEYDENNVVDVASAEAAKAGLQTKLDEVNARIKELEPTAFFNLGPITANAASLDDQTFTGEQTYTGEGFEVAPMESLTLLESYQELAQRIQDEIAYIDGLLNQ